MSKINYNIYEIINEVKMYQKRSNNYEIVKSPSAEGFINLLGRYKKYCYEDKKEEWTKSIESIIYSPLIVFPNIEMNEHIKRMIDEADIEILSTIYERSLAGEIMEIYYKTKSWRKIDKLLREQKEIEEVIINVGDILVEYSEMGNDFKNRYKNKVKGKRIKNG